MAIASINIKPVKSKSSESHNQRDHEMEHVHSNLSVNNESWIKEVNGDPVKIALLRKAQEAYCKKIRT